MSLPSSMADFVPRDCYLQKAYFAKLSSNAAKIRHYSDNQLCFFVSFKFLNVLYGENDKCNKNATN